MKIHLPDDALRASIDRADLYALPDPHEPAVGRYQGNGRFGTLWSPLGLHAHPSEQAAWNRHGRTQFTHLRHWGRFPFRSTFTDSDTTGDYLLPLLRLYWETPPQQVHGHEQRQNFFDGTLHTRFRHGARGDAVSLTNWFDPEQRDLAVIELDGHAPALILATEPRFCPYDYAYKLPVEQTLEAHPEEDTWVLTVRCGGTAPEAVSRVVLQTDARVERCAAGLRLTPAPGRSRIALSYGAATPADLIDSSLQRTRAHWQRQWATLPQLDLPDDRHQQMWVRSLAYILSTFNDDGIGFAPTNGLTGNMFPFNFAQDLMYVHPLLLACGRADIPRAWVERFSALIAPMQAYARHLWPEVDGIYPPWELPFGPIEGFHAPGVPIVFCYEPHNAACLARIAHDTACALDDPAWTATHARPLIDQIARFYKSFCRREDDGRWHLQLTPSCGQDEAGGRHQKDYLCGLYSAQYVFQLAVLHGLDGDGHYARVLADGLAFESLRTPQGFFYASAGSGPQDFGRQKHPVQLNGLSWMPVRPGPSAEELQAHALRYDTTARATEPFFFGWTLGQFLLASSHAGDTAAWQRDWAQIEPSHYVDPQWASIRETSGHAQVPFYVTTHGLVATSLLDNLVSDYWGELQIGAANPYDATVRFANVRSALGVTVSGELRGPHGSVRLQAWRDCTLSVHGQTLTLKRDEQHALTF